MKTKTFFVVAAYVAVLSCTSHAQAQLTTKPKNLVYVCTMPSAGRFSFNVTGPAELKNVVSAAVVRNEGGQSAFTCKTQFDPGAKILSVSIETKVLPPSGAYAVQLLDGEKVVKFTLPLTVKAFARIGGSGLPERTPVINPSPPKIKIQSTSADILRKKITSIFQAARGVNDGIAGIRPGDSIAESRLWRPFKVTSYYPEVAVSGSTVVLEGTTLNAVPSELFFGGDQASADCYDRHNERLPAAGGEPIHHRAPRPDCAARGSANVDADRERLPRSCCRAGFGKVIELISPTVNTPMQQRPAEFAVRNLPRTVHRRQHVDVSIVCPAGASVDSDSDYLHDGVVRLHGGQLTIGFTGESVATIGGILISLDPVEFVPTQGAEPVRTTQIVGPVQVPQAQATPGLRRGKSPAIWTIISSGLFTTASARRKAILICPLSAARSRLAI